MTFWRTSTCLQVASLAFCLSACTGEPLTVEDMAPEDAYGPADAGHVSMRRLTQAQFQNTIRDLFGDDIVVPEVAEPDVVSGGLPSVGASEATYSPRGVESLEAAAYSVSSQVMDSEERRVALVPCTPTDTVDTACTTEVVRQLGRRAWRRTLTEDEVTRIVGVADAAASTLGDFHEGLEYAVGALLQSPYFLYRVEVGEVDPDQPDRRRFTDAELASRLSFFLWNTTPDDALLDAAESGALSTREGLFAEASRLLESPRAQAGMRNFFTEQFKLYDLDDLSKDPALFEHYTTLLGPDAREETLRLFDYAVFEAEMDYREIMTTRETFITPRLAALYDLPAAAEGDAFSYVELPKKGPRAGLLGHASFLSLNAHAVSSSATLRGKAVRTVLLCQHIPVPPVNVDTSIPEASGTTLTLRDRVAEHLENPSCAGCHELLDPIGLGLENFDGLGRYRELDNGARIDPTGVLDTELFVDARELGKLIGEHERFPVCAVQTLGRYASGRIEADSESAWLDVLTERFEHHDYRIKALLLEVIMSPLFRQAGEPN